MLAMYKLLKVTDREHSKPGLGPISTRWVWHGCYYQVHIPHSEHGRILLQTLSILLLVSLSSIVLYMVDCDGRSGVLCTVQSQNSGTACHSRQDGHHNIMLYNLLHTIQSIYYIQFKYSKYVKPSFLTVADCNEPEPLLQACASGDFLNNKPFK